MISRSQIAKRNFWRMSYLSNHRRLARTVVGWMALAIALATSECAVANDCCCKKCGCETKKVCRLVCEDEKIKEHEWKCECEDFCLPPPSHCCGEHCECDCGNKFGEWCYKIWHPAGCPELRTRKILIKIEKEKKVPRYHWVVEDVCEQCGCKTASKALQSELTARSAESAERR